MAPAEPPAMGALLQIPDNLPEFVSLKRPRRRPAANWFEECTNKQLQQLCQAAKLPSSGTKEELVDRLLQDNFVKQFGGNKKLRMPSMRQVEENDWPEDWGNVYTLAALKDQCRERLLQVSGTKFDLVLRVVQHENGTGGESLKRASLAKAKSVTVDGEEIHVAKKRQRARPCPDTFYTRVEKKILSYKQKKYKSNYGSKQHGQDVLMLMEDLMEAVREETEGQLVCECCLAIIAGFVDNFDYILRPGYCSGCRGVAENIGKRMAQMHSAVKAETLEALATAMLEFGKLVSPYALLENCDMPAIIEQIRGGALNAGAT